MDHRRKQYVQSLGLVPLPQEGGYFKETIRSPNKVPTKERDGGERNLFTTIYYMMTPELGGKNYLQRINSDCVYYFHDGWPAKYVLVSPEGKYQEHILGHDVSKGHVLQLFVPKGYLKAGKILVQEEGWAKFPGEAPFTLVSEQVSPGFDPRDRPELHADNINTSFPNLWPHLEEYLRPLDA
ncbi:uncharacterized protein LOC141893657 [Acropora palmata]|uniref:uncharacterized protein LOC141893657 n=1 Tax=Acropora palmata TaxID=6131 RepID=UPI003DA0ED07